MVVGDVIHWTHKGRPMGYLYVRGVGCEDPVVIYIYIQEFELMGGGGGIACNTFADGPWCVCCEYPAVMWYINQKLKSQGTPHVLSSRTIRGVSAVRIL